MKGIEQLLSHTYSEQECKRIIDTLDNAFTAAYSVFGIEGCFLRMAKGRDESGELLWQPSTRADKTATALQVGAFFATMKPRAVLGESETNTLSSRWIEFMNSAEGFDKTGYLGDRGQPGRQNSGSLWSWQRTWLKRLNLTLNIWKNRFRKCLPKSTLDIHEKKYYDGSRTLVKNSLLLSRDNIKPTLLRKLF